MPLGYWPQETKLAVFKIFRFKKLLATLRKIFRCKFGGVFPEEADRQPQNVKVLITRKKTASENFSVQHPGPLIALCIARIWASIAKIIPRQWQEEQYRDKFISERRDGHSIVFPLWASAAAKSEYSSFVLQQKLIPSAHQFYRGPSNTLPCPLLGL